ncbi:MAG: ATP-binding cassette domain-containing protein, partial [Bdellovibrionales bacterium]
DSNSYSGTGQEKLILDKFNQRLQRGDRIGIVGKNGSGKTSFLRLLVGELKPDAGSVKLAKDLSLSYFDQKRAQLHPDHSLHRILCPNGSDYIDVMGKTRHVCGYLKDFLFDPQMVHHPVGALSGGQKNRLMLAKILANPGNLLILDEPTNDLDMETLDMLEDMLANYKGTLLVVSHDRDFLDQTVSKILAFEGNGRVEGIIGGYEDYLAARRKNAPAPEPARASARRATSTGHPPAPPADSVRKLTFTEKHEFKNLPAKIDKLQKEIDDIETTLADPALYSNNSTDFQNYSKRLAIVRHEMEAAERRWLELGAIEAG